MTHEEQEVIRRATLVASWKPGTYSTTSATAARELDNLKRAIDRLNRP